LIKYFVSLVPVYIHSLLKMLITWCITQCRPRHHEY